MYHSRLTNPIPSSWLAVEHDPDGTYSVVRCYPDTIHVSVVRSGIKTAELAARYIDRQKTAFGHNADIKG